jgi:hypothetical protein
MDTKIKSTKWYVIKRTRDGFLMVQKGAYINDHSSEVEAASEPFDTEQEAISLYASLIAASIK